MRPRRLFFFLLVRLVAFFADFVLFGGVFAARMRAFLSGGDGFVAAI